MKEERSPYPGKLLHWWGDQLGQKGSFRGSEESAAVGSQQAEQRKTSIDGLCQLPSVPSPRRMSAGACGG